MSAPGDSGFRPVHLYLDNDFAEMATGFQIFERRRDILHLERLVDYWSDVEVFDHADHPLEHLDLRLTFCDREDPSARGDRELQCEYADSTGTLHEHRLSGLEVADLEQGIPRCQGRSWERRRFLE